MVASVVKEKIYKLKLDAKDLDKGLKDAASNVSSFNSKVKNVDTKNLSNIDSGVKSVSTGFKNLLSHIPGLGSLNSNMKETGVAAKDLASGVNNIKGDGINSVASGASNAASSMGDLTSGVQQSASAFSVLQGAASVALGNIATQAIYATSNLIKNSTITPIIQGYQEYERELESTRVLVGALGEDQQDMITSVMRDLEKYAQTTRYSSQQMNSSLSQFVNAGVDINVAATALKGWGNLAASSAASTDQFNSSLKFGVQQALAMGYMNRMNWSSVENAQMGTIKFKQQLIEVAKLEGTVTDEMIAKYGGIQGMFVDALADERWLTNDVLMKALDDYANKAEFQKMAENIYTFKEAMEATTESVNDAWSKMWVELVGKGDEAMAIWTPLSKVMVNLTTAIPNGVTSIAKAFNDLNGRSVVISALVQGFKSLSLIGKGVGKAIGDIFPTSKMKTTLSDGTQINTMYYNMAQTIIKVANRIKEMFTIQSDASGRVKDAIADIVGVFLRLGTVIGKLMSITGRLFDILIPDNLIQNGIIILGSLANMFNSVFDLIDSLLSKLDTTGVVDFFDSADKAVSKFWDTVTKVLAGATSGSFGGLGKLFSIDKPDNKSILEGITDSIGSSGIFESISKTVATLRSRFSGIGLEFNNIFKSIDFSSMNRLFKTSLQGIADIFDWFADHMSGVSDTLANVFKFIAGIFTTILDKINIDTLLKIINTILLFKLKSGVIDGIGALAKPFEAIASAIGSLRVDIFKQVGNTLKAFQAQLKAEALKSIATALVEMAAALLVVSLIPTDKLLPSVTALAGAAVILVGAYAAIQAVNNKQQGGGLISSIISGFGFPEVKAILKRIASATAIIALASSVIMVAQVIKTLASMDWDDMQRGILGMTEVIAVLTAGTWLSGFSKAKIGTGLTMAAIAVAIKTMVDSIKILSDIDQDTIDKGNARLLDIALLLGGVMALLGGDLTLGGKLGNAVSAGLSVSTGNQSFGTAASLLVLMKYIKNVVDTVVELGEYASNNQSNVDKATSVLQSILNSVALIIGIAGSSLNIGASGGTQGIGTKVGNTNGKAGIQLAAGNTKWSTAATLLAIFSGISSIASAVEKLASIDVGKLQNGVNVIQKIGITLGLLFAAIQMVSRDWSIKGNTFNGGFGLKDLAGLIAIIGGLVLLTYSIAPLSLIDPERLNAATNAIGTIGVTIAGIYAVVSLISKYGEIKLFNFASLLVIVVGLIALSYPLATLAGIDSNSLHSAELALGVIALVIAALGAVFTALSSLNTSNIAGAAVTILGMVTMIASAIVLANVVQQLSSIDTAGLVKGEVALLGITAIIAVLGALFLAGGALATLIVDGTVGTALLGMASLIAGMLTMVYAVQQLADVVIALAPISWEDLMKGGVAILGLGIIIAVLGLLMSIMAIVATFGIFGVVAQLAIIQNLVTGIQQLAAVAIGLSGYDLGALDSAVNVMIKIAVILGASVALLTIFSNFTNVEGAEGQIQIVQNVVNGIAGLASTAIVLSNYDPEQLGKAVDVMAKIADILNGATFMASISSLFTNEEKAEAEGKLAKSVVKNISSMAALLNYMGTAYDLKAMSKALNIVKAIASFIDALDITNWIKKIIGAKGESADGMKKASKTFSYLGNMAQAVNMIGSLTIDIDDVNTKISSIANIYKTISKTLGDIKGISDKDLSKLDNYKSAMAKMSDMGMAAAQMSAAQYNSTDVTKTRALVMSLQSALGGLSNVGLTAGTNVASSFKMGLDSGAPGASASGLALINGVRTSLTTNNDMSVGGITIGNTFNSGLGSLVPTVLGTATNMTNSVKSSIGNNSDVTGHGNKIGSTYAGGILALLNSASNAGSSLNNSARAGIGSNNDATGHGNTIGRTYSGGIRSKEGDSRSAGNALAHAAKGGLTVSQEFLAGITNSGLAIANQFASGLGSQSAIAKVGSAAQGLISAARSMFPNSPAKKGPLSGYGWTRLRMSGEAIVKQFSAGLNKTAPVESAAISIIDEVQSVLSTVSDYTYDDMNLQPTITPVLDLTSFDPSALDALNGSQVTAATTGLSLNYDTLNRQSLQMSLQQGSLDTLATKLNAINSGISGLNDSTTEQTGVLREGQTLNTYIDGTKLNKTLAPGMQDAQTTYQSRLSRIEGVIQ